MLLQWGALKMPDTDQPVEDLFCQPPPYQPSKYDFPR